MADNGADGGDDGGCSQCRREHCKGDVTYRTAGRAPTRNLSRERISSLE